MIVKTVKVLVYIVCLALLVSCSSIDDIAIGSKLSGESLSEAISTIEERINTLWDMNAYFKVIEGEDKYSIYMLNSNRECLVQGDREDYITVYRNDGYSIRYTDMIILNKDVDILTMLINALELVKSNKAVIYTAEIESITGDSKLTAYDIYIKGWDRIEGIYKGLNDNQIQVIKDNVSSNFKSVDDIIYKYRVVVGSGGELSIGAYIIDNEIEYTLWYFDGYIDLYDWKLDNEWYSYDFKDAGKSEEMLVTLVNELGDNINLYLKENNINIGNIHANDNSCTCEEYLENGVCTDENCTHDHSCTCEESLESSGGVGIEDILDGDVCTDENCTHNH